MATEIKAPVFPESVADGTIATWHKQPGEAVSRDEVICDIETDKVVLEVVAPADGTIASIIKGEGDTVLSFEQPLVLLSLQTELLQFAQRQIQHLLQTVQSLHLKEQCIHTLNNVLLKFLLNIQM